MSPGTRYMEYAVENLSVENLEDLSFLHSIIWYCDEFKERER